MRLRWDPSPGDPVLRSVLIATIAAVWAAARWFPFEVLPPLCWWRRALGVPCPACGMTRAWVHVAHGDLAAAWAMSPLGAALPIGAACVAVALLLRPRVPAPVLLLSDREAWGLRGLIVAAILANWGYVVTSGRI